MWIRRLQSGSWRRLFARVYWSHSSCELQGGAGLSSKNQPTVTRHRTDIPDPGLRPEEVFRIRVENIDFAARTIFNPFGKTKAARRTVTMTDTVWTSLKRRAKTANGSYVFPSEKHPDRP